MENGVFIYNFQPITVLNRHRYRVDRVFFETDMNIGIKAVDWSALDREHKEVLSDFIYDNFSKRGEETRQVYERVIYPHVREGATIFNANGMVLRRYYEHMWKVENGVPHKLGENECPFTGNVAKVMMYVSRYDVLWVNDTWAQEHCAKCSDCGAYYMFPDYLETVYDGEEKLSVCLTCYAKATKFYCDYHNRTEVGEAMFTFGSRNRYRKRYCKSAYNALVEQYGEPRECSCGHVDFPHTYVSPIVGAISGCIACVEKYRRSDIDEESVEIKGYGFKPPAKFWGESGVSYKATAPLYIGVELETNDSEECASDIARRFAHKLYCKSDCSLNDGVEIVSHPFTPAYFEKFDWEGVCDEVNAVDGTDEFAGMHMHVSRAGFNGDMSRARFGFLFSRFYDNFLTISQRYDDEDELRWCKPTYIRNFCPEDEYEAEELLCDFVSEASDDRYYAVNYDNVPTLEVRLWGASLVPNVIRTLGDVTQAMVAVANNLTNLDVYMITWEELKERVFDCAQNRNRMVEYFNRCGA